MSIRARWATRIAVGGICVGLIQMLTGFLSNKTEYDQIQKEFGERMFKTGTAVLTGYMDRNKVANIKLTNAQQGEPVNRNELIATAFHFSYGYAALDLFADIRSKDTIQSFLKERSAAD